MRHPHSHGACAGTTVGRAADKGAGSCVDESELGLDYRTRRRAVFVGLTPVGTRAHIPGVIRAVDVFLGQSEEEVTTIHGAGKLFLRVVSRSLWLFLSLTR